MSAWGNRSC